MFPDLNIHYFKNILKNKTVVSVEYAIFRDPNAFVTANLGKYILFWEHEILKDDPHKKLS